MKFEEYRMRHPVAVTIRDGDEIKRASIDTVTFRCRDEGDIETDLALAESCARGLVRANGDPARPVDLMRLHVRGGMMDAARRACEFAGIPA